MPEAETPLPSLDALLKASGFKHAHLQSQLGLKSDRSWQLMRQNSNAWTVQQIRTLADLLRITPHYLFDVLAAEADAAATDPPS